jgi:hypothetical protein
MGPAGGGIQGGRFGQPGALGHDQVLAALLAAKSGFDLTSPEVAVVADCACICIRPRARSGAHYVALRPGGQPPPTNADLSLADLSLAAVDLSGAARSPAAAARSPAAAQPWPSTWRQCATASTSRAGELLQHHLRVQALRRGAQEHHHAAARARRGHQGGGHQDLHGEGQDAVPQVPAPQAQALWDSNVA